MDDFSAIRFKRRTIKRFKAFSKQIAPTHSGTLEAMMDFFEAHSLSPFESLGANMVTLESKIKRRINALIAIVKDIEKNQTKPTNAMMQSLFEETSNIEKDDGDTFGFGTPKLITENEELDYYKNAYYKTQETYNDLKQDTKGLLKKIKYVRNNFGIGHYRLDLTKETLETLKRKLDHVHHHNPTETGW